MNAYTIAWTAAIVCLCLSAFGWLFGAAWWRVIVAMLCELGIAILISAWANVSLRGKRE